MSNKRDRVCHHVRSYVRIRLGRLEHVTDYWRCCGEQLSFAFSKAA